MRRKAIKAKSSSVGVEDTAIFSAIEAAFLAAEKADPKEYDAILGKELQKVWEEHDLITLHMPCSVASGLGD